MIQDFKFKNKPDIKRVELKSQKTAGDAEEITHLAYFMCPACNHMGMLAYGSASAGVEKQDWCVYCGQLVTYKIPEMHLKSKGTVI